MCLNNFIIFNILKITSVIITEIKYMIEKYSLNIIINNSKKYNINNKYSDYLKSLPDDINNIPNILLYGPPGVGKYTEALKIIEKYSPSNLKYEKKMTVSSHKNEHIIKISDIHYEINMENLTCNSKILINDIYNNIIDSIESSRYKRGIILCKNFHHINNELLEIFYSYMQKIINRTTIIKFIIITQNISFIPKPILDVCKILYYSKLSLSNYVRLSNINNKKFLLNLKKSNTIHNCTKEKNIINSLDNINLLKYLDLNNDNLNILNLKKSLCDNIVNIILYK